MSALYPFQLETAMKSRIKVMHTAKTVSPKTTDEIIIIILSLFLRSASSVGHLRKRVRFTAKNTVTTKGIMTNILVIFILTILSFT